MAYAKMLLELTKPNTNATMKTYNVNATHETCRTCLKRNSHSICQVCDGQSLYERDIEHYGFKITMQ